MGLLHGLRHNLPAPNLTNADSVFQIVQQSRMPPAALARMAYKGRLIHELRGIYRFPDVAQDKYADYRLALAWGSIAGPAALDSASALLLWDLLNPFGRDRVKDFGIHVVIPPQRRIKTLGRPHYWWATGDCAVSTRATGLPLVSPVDATRRSLDQGLIHTRQAFGILDRCVERGMLSEGGYRSARASISRWIRVGTFGWKDPMVFGPSVKRPPPIHRGA